MLLCKHYEDRLRRVYPLALDYINAETVLTIQAENRRTLLRLINVTPSGNPLVNIEQHKFNIPNFWDLMLRLLCIRTLILTMLRDNEQPPTQEFELSIDDFPDWVYSRINPHSNEVLTEESEIGYAETIIVDQGTQVL